MVTESLLAQIADNPKLPTPPALTLRILDQASRPSCTLHEIGRIISADAGLCSKMLKLVNSTLYGLQRPVTSIDRALHLLGVNHVRALVLSLSLPSLRFRHASSTQMKTFWKSSVTTAIVCRELAALRKWPDPDSEMVAGLLCDLGELLLQETIADGGAEEGGSLDHAEVGAYCLARWKLAPELTEAIRFHHHPEAAPPAVANRTYLLSFASCVARLHQAPDQAGLLAEIVALARQRFNLSDEPLLTFLESLNQKIDDFARLIDVDLGVRESLTELFAKATENLSRLASSVSLDNVRMQEEMAEAERRLELAGAALAKTEEQLRQAQKMEAIGRLAGGVAHDFNNLLTVIVGNCELFCNWPSINAEAREMIDMVRQSGERAAELTHQLLAFSRQQRLNPEVIDLNDCAANLTRMLRRLLGADVQLVTRFADDLALVKMDPSQLAQVMMNLAVNARDAMPQGGCLTIETFNLHVSEEVAAKNPEVHPGAYVVLAVRDTGCGIKEELLPHIFEPFFTTKAEGEGTGLGLATVHGIVRQSGGSITVSSVLGRGSVFHIYLPVAEGPPLNFGAELRGDPRFAIPALCVPREFSQPLD